LIQKLQIKSVIKEVLIKSILIVCNSIKERYLL